MRYDDPELRTLLAGEYALGTLAGAARRRFERLLIDDARLRLEVLRWEERFAAWVAWLQPEPPPARVWRALQRRLTPTRARPRIPLWASPVFWRGLAVAAILALIAVILVPSAPQKVPAPPELAVVTNKTGKPLWLVSAHPATRHLDVRAIKPVIPPAGKAYQLWMLPAKGQKPVSLGLLPRQGTLSRKLSARRFSVLTSAAGVAVSIEPPGGSPTGQPTGPVVFQAPLVKS
jgi:anti-sigma-K factor RskA